MGSNGVETTNSVVAAIELSGIPGLGAVRFLHILCSTLHTDLPISRVLLINLILAKMHIAHQPVQYSGNRNPMIYANCI